MPCASNAELALVELGLDHEQRARRLAARRGVEQHDGVVALAERVGEVHAADAEVDDLDARRAARAGRAGRRARRRSRRRRGRRCRCRPPARAAVAGAAVAERLDLLGREEEAVPGLAPLAEVAARVVVDRPRRGARRPPCPARSPRRPRCGRRARGRTRRRRRAGAGARGCRGAARRRRPRRESGAGRSSSSQQLIARRITALADAPCSAAAPRSGPRCARGSRARAGRCRASRPSPRRSG